jgi:hypothetical protein
MPIVIFPIHFYKIVPCITYIKVQGLWRKMILELSLGQNGACILMLRLVEWQLRNLR